MIEAIIWMVVGAVSVIVSLVAYTAWIINRQEKSK